MKPNVSNLLEGSRAFVVTERGRRVEVVYALVEAAALVTSHDTALKVNPHYPGALQPRDRARVASLDQIARIAQGLQPELLMATAKASDGAPIIGADLIVESGNARCIALKRAYEMDMQSAKDYRWYLGDNCEPYGFEMSHVLALDSPVLVRVRITELDRVAFATEANEQSVAAMSASEQARVDASRLEAGMMEIFYPSDEGEIQTAANRPFVRAFIERVAAQTERGRLMDASGLLSQDGVRRIQNAVLAKAYGDTEDGAEAIARLAEATDDNVKRISTALLHKSGRFATLKAGIADGVRYPLDITGDLACVMRKMSVLRIQGTTVADYLKQGGLFGEELSDFQKRVLTVFEEQRRSQKAITSIMDRYLKLADAAGNPSQVSLVPLPAPEIAELWERAVHDALEGEGEQVGLFSAAAQQPAAAAPTVPLDTVRLDTVPVDRVVAPAPVPKPVAAPVIGCVGCKRETQVFKSGTGIKTKCATHGKVIAFANKLAPGALEQVQVEHDRMWNERRCA